MTDRERVERACGCLIVWVLIILAGLLALRLL